MPLVRFIHPPDVRVHGDGPVVVEDVQAKVLTEMRRAVLVTEGDLADLKKAELVDLADEAGVAVPKRDAKGHFVKAIVPKLGMREIQDRGSSDEEFIPTTPKPLEQ